jgi:hypothetical protein
MKQSGLFVKRIAGLKISENFRENVHYCQQNCRNMCMTYYLRQNVNYFRKYLSKTDIFL